MECPNYVATCNIPLTLKRQSTVRFKRVDRNDRIDENYYLTSPQIVMPPPVDVHRKSGEIHSVVV